MAIIALTPEEYQQVVERLISLSENVNGTSYHSVGPEYTSLMICFLLHNAVSAKSLLRLRDSFGNGWFPATVGYAIVRPMFEVDVTAHYITQSPLERSRQYIDFESVLNKQEMDAYSKHRNSDKPGWREPLNLAWQQHWASKQPEINSRYEAVCHSFEKISKKGKILPHQNWSGKSIHQMAIEVDHEEAYDIFYAELSSFSHVDVRFANKFLRLRPDGLSWSLRPGEFDVGNVFRHAATFLDCFLNLFATQFKIWSNDDVKACWNIARTGN
jgi:hypothetical protein